MRIHLIAVAPLLIAVALATEGQPAEAQLQIKPKEQPVQQQKAKAETKKSSKKVTVKKGDSLTKIAKKNDTTWRRLYDANLKVKHPDVIYPGDKLRVPNAKEKLKQRPLPKAPQPVKKQSVSVNKPVVRYTPRVSYPAVSSSGSVWDRLAMCESGGNWSINTGNGYYGGLQFTLSTWQSVGGSGYPHQASKAEQIYRAQILQARSGWGQWPACAAKLGLL